MNYHHLFLDGVRAWLSAYEGGTQMLYTEADLQSHLFFHLVALMRDRNFDQPYEIHVNHSVRSAQEKIDMVLGDGEVLIELKFEPDYPELPNSKKPVVFKKDIEKEDFERMGRYAQLGYRYCYALVLDEDGIHHRAFRA